MGIDPKTRGRDRSSLKTGMTTVTWESAELEGPIITRGPGRSWGVQNLYRFD